MQMVMFAPKSEWKPPNINDLPSWKNAKLASIDVETKDPQLKKYGPGPRRDGKLVGISFCLDNGVAYYLPISHAGGGNMDREQVLRYLRDQAKVFKGTLVGANLSYDLDYIEENGIFFVCKKVDIQVVEPLINELQLSFALNALARKYGFPEKDEAVLREAAKAFGVNPKAELWKLHSKFVGPYAEHDAWLPGRIWVKQQLVLTRENLWRIANLEIAVTPVLLKMRRRGVLIDQDALDRVENESRRQEQEFLDKVKYKTGIDIPLGSTMTVGPLILALQHEGISVPYTVKTNGKRQYSVTKELLSGWGEVGNNILQARQACKIRDTFVKTIRGHMTNGRIHGIYRQIVTRDENGQTGASFGRLAAGNPNLQQLPAHTALGIMIKMAFIPEAGHMWGCHDFSAQEPRWGTEYGFKLGLKGAKESLDDLLNDAKCDVHQSMANLTGLSRTNGKRMRLSLSYCQGGAKTAVSLGLPTAWAHRSKSGEFTPFTSRMEAMAYRTECKEGSVMEVAGEEASEIINQFNSKAPFVKLFSKAATQRAEEVGKVITDGGRVLHFEQDQNGEYMYCYRAGNRIIQGSSADQVKAAVVAIDEELPHIFLQTQTHDDIGASVKNIQESKDIGEVMVNICKHTKSPWRCDIEVGPSMGSYELVCNAPKCCNMAVKGYDASQKFCEKRKNKFFCEKHERNYWTHKAA